MRFAIMVMLAVTTYITAPKLSEACLGGRQGPADLSQSNILLESASESPIVLRSGRVHSLLHSSQHLGQAAPDEVLRLAIASRRLLLLLCDLRAAETPETLFHVYLNLPEKVDQDARARHLIAQFNFFTALRPGDKTLPVWQSFDITQPVDILTKQGDIKTKVTLTILAAQPFDPKSRPSVGHIAIVQQ